MQSVLYKVKEEYRNWHIDIIANLPGKTGNFLRERWVRKNAKKCGFDILISKCVVIISPEKLIIGTGVGMKFQNRTIIQSVRHMLLRKGTKI